jgi:cyanuric acid amidohydrolase
MTRRAIVHRISASAPDDVSGIEAAIASQRIDPKGVIAVLAKTEGNGLVNDFSRGHASLALSLLFERHLATDEAARICLVMSGGTEGAMAPHWLVFERAGGDGRSIKWSQPCARPCATQASMMRRTCISSR